MTLLDIMYEECCALVCSAACAPDQLFLPLLAEAQGLGVNPNLGRSTKLDRSALVQHAVSNTSVEPAAGGRTLLAQQGPMAQQSGPAAAEGGAQRQGDSARRDGLVEAGGKALRQEEVLMFHRAASRLGEMCRVVEVGPQDT